MRAVQPASRCWNRPATPVQAMLRRHAAPAAPHTNAAAASCLPGSRRRTLCCCASLRPRWARRGGYTACSARPPWRPTLSGCHPASLRAARGAASRVCWAGLGVGCAEQGVLRTAGAQGRSAGTEPPRWAPPEAGPRTKSAANSCRAGHGPPESSRSPRLFHRTAITMPRWPDNSERSTPAHQASRARGSEWLRGRSRVRECAKQADNHLRQPGRCGSPMPNSSHPPPRAPPSPPPPRTLSAEQPHGIVGGPCGQRLAVGAPLQTGQLHAARRAALRRVPAHAHAPAAAAARFLEVPDASGAVAGC